MLVYYKDKVWVKEHRCLFIIKTKCGLKSIDAWVKEHRCLFIIKTKCGLKSIDACLL